MPARTRTKRRSSLPAILISRLRPSTYNLRAGEVRTIVCPGCDTWQRIMGDKTLTIRDHNITDLADAEVSAGQTERRCPSARRIVEIDLTVDEITKWQQTQDRRISPDAMPAETRRAARQHYKPLPAEAPALIRFTGGHAVPSVPAPRGEQRAEQWAERLLLVFTADAERRIALIDAPGTHRGPIRSLPLPDGVSTEPLPKHGNRTARTAA